MAKAERTLNSVWQKLMKQSKAVGQKTSYAALLMFYAFLRKETPAFARTIILGTLSYFLAPIDAIPDLSPVIGYTDDLGVLSFGLVTIAAYINDDVRIKARKAVLKLFKTIDLEVLQTVDKRL